MKQFLSILIVLTLCKLSCFAQKAAPDFEEPMELDRGLIVTFAQWENSTNAIKAYLNNKKSLWVKDEDLPKWLKSYNKENGTKYILLNRSVNQRKAVLATPEYVNQMKTNVLLGSSGDNFRSDNELRYNAVATCGEFVTRAGRDFLFLENGSYTYALKAGVDYTRNDILNTDELYASVPNTSGKLLNGKVSLRIYDKVTNMTVAVYRGEMKNGVPDGNGLFIKRDPACREGYVRKGLWREGRFVKEEYLGSLPEKSGAIVLKGVNATDLKTIIEEGSFNPDPLLPGMDNGYLVKIFYTWQQGDKKRFVRVCVHADDYMSQQAAIEILAKDDWDDEIPFVRNARLQQQSNDLAGLFNMGKIAVQQMVERQTTSYDNYLRYYTLSWSSLENTRPYQWGDRIDFTTIFFDTRTKRSDNWKEAGRLTIYRSHYPPADQDITTDVRSFLSYNFKQSYPSATALLDELLPAIKKTYPSPTKDTSTERKQVVTENIVGKTKMGSVKNRLLTARVFDFSAKDSLTGIWQSQGDVNVINSQTMKFYSISERTLNLVPYQAAVNEYGYELKGKLLTVFAIYGGKRSDVKKYAIKEIKRDEIKFDDGSSWERVRE